MQVLIWLTSLAASIIALRMALQIRAELAAWTVFQSWNWMIAALLGVILLAVISLPAVSANAAVKSVSCYFAATLLLTPLVTTLGARRPGISAWHGFVVLPMVAVLQWPALSQLTGSHWRTPLELSAPATMGAVVVLIMSAGTMLGTRAAGFALLYSLGILMMLAPATIYAASQSSVDAGGAVLILAAFMTVRRNLARSRCNLMSGRDIGERTAALWELFGSLYGIAWTRRVQDRVNQFASAEKWTVRLTAAGFERPDGSAPTDDEMEQPLNAFIWVMARFVDKVWLQAVLNPQNQHLPPSRLS